MPRPFRPAVSRLFGAVALALAGLAAAPQWAMASDIGAVIESARLSRYPLREPEKRVWGTENVKDAVLVGELQSRLYLYRYVREPGGKFRPDFRSGPLVMYSPTGIKTDKESVRVRMPRDGESHYWVGYSYDGDLWVTGFLVDEEGSAYEVTADNSAAIVSSDQPWDDVRKARILAALRPPLADYPDLLKTFPESISFEHRPRPDLKAGLLDVHRHVRGIPRAQTAEFRRALGELRSFFWRNDYRDVDPTGKDPEVLTAFNDYGFWLAESGEAQEADLFLGEVLRRDPARTAAYLNRADARWQQAGKAGDKRGHFEALAREDYRQYCSRRLAAQEPVPGNIAGRIGAALGVPALDAAACRPRLAIFQAIQAGDVAAVQAELARGQDPNGVNENGTPALAAGVARKQLEIVRILLAAGARADGSNNGYPLLASALPDGQDSRPDAERYALADTLIAAGAPVDAVDSGGTPLLMRRISYYSGDKDNLLYLLDKGANPNAREKNGRSLLHAAMQSTKNFWYAEKLLDKGADINAAYVRMYYGNRAMWETPLLEALRESPGGELAPGVAYPIPERVSFALAHGADPAVGGYGEGKALERNGLNEALSLAARYMQPALVDQLVQAAGKPQAPLTPESLSSLLSVWNQVEVRAAIKQNGPDWDELRARLRATAARLLAAGVPLTQASDATGVLANRIAPLSVPWLPDDLYLQWLQAGADVSDRTDQGIRIQGVADPDALPLVIMLRLGQEAKAKMLLEHDAGLYRTPWRCGAAVADMLAWQASQDGGPQGPAGARAVKQVLDGAEAAPACDLNQRARVQPFVGVSASELARRANITLSLRPAG